MISVYSFTIQNGTCQRPRTLWNRSATKFVLPSEKSTRQMRLENGQSQLFDNIQNLFVKERFINQINSLIPKFNYFFVMLSMYLSSVSKSRSSAIVCIIKLSTYSAPRCVTSVL